MVMQQMIGAAGVVLLIAAWLWETFENIKKHKIELHPHFAVLYLAGNALLTTYAWTIHDQVFFWLGIVLFVAILSEVVYATYINYK